MTYDEWKLETPEDEADRKARYWKSWGWRGRPAQCPNCGDDYCDDDGRCAACGIDPTINERDPDDERDRERDDAKWDSD